MEFSKAGKSINYLPGEYEDLLKKLTMRIRTDAKKVQSLGTGAQEFHKIHTQVELFSKKCYEISEIFKKLYYMGVIDLNYSEVMASLNINFKELVSLRKNQKKSVLFEIRIFKKGEE